MGQNVRDTLTSLGADDDLGGDAHFDTRLEALQAAAKTGGVDEHGNSAPLVTAVAH